MNYIKNKKINFISFLILKTNGLNSLNNYGHNLWAKIYIYIELKTIEILINDNENLT
jgi:hypothetical protein